MPFDIHQPVFEKESGDYLEKVALRYREELAALFEASVEGKILSDEGIQPGWVDILIDLGINYLQVTPAQMSAADLRIILFQLIPRKISASADDVPDAIREFQLFWTFLQREFHVALASACLKILNEKGTVAQMRKEMDTPANFGMAKSLITMGMQRGFDMTTQEGIDSWIATYNAEIRAGTGTPLGISTPRGTGEGTGKTKRKGTQNRRKENHQRKNGNPHR